MFLRGGRIGSKRRPGTTPVYLNVYDLTPINGYAYWLGLGVYHSGVQVHNVEYAYGAHDQPSTGIFESEPRQCPGFSFRKSILIGQTDMSPREIHILIDNMGASYTGNVYNLISKNCNHFCNDLCLRIADKQIPKWVNRLARIGLLCNCVLPVHVAAVRQENSRGDRVMLRSNSTKYPLTGTNSRTNGESSGTSSKSMLRSLSTGSKKSRRSNILSLKP
ncbi:hypothetical protein LUZ60_000926 [Juncus effusus]|nr:hypothetical protein LUZ60_000926 [Juncus effusus]